MSDVNAYYRAAREVLTEKQFDAWRLVIWQGMSLRKAAGLLHISKGALDSRLKLAETKISARVRPHCHSAGRAEGDRENAAAA